MFRHFGLMHVRHILTKVLAYEDMKKNRAHATGLPMSP